jgi:hypothetical protein
MSSPFKKRFSELYKTYGVLRIKFAPADSATAVGPGPAARGMPRRRLGLMTLTIPAIDEAQLDPFHSMHHVARRAAAADAHQRLAGAASS